MLGESVDHTRSVLSQKSGDWHSRHRQRARIVRHGQAGGVADWFSLQREHSQSVGGVEAGLLLSCHVA